MTQVLPVLIIVFFAAFTFRAGGLIAWVRRLLIASGVLAFAGLIGVFFGNMQIRDIGVGGYVGVFFIATVLLAVLFYREKTAGEMPAQAKP